MMLGEFMNTLTGFEELAVKSMAGVPLDELTGDKQRGIPIQYSLLTRCMAAVKTMREEPQVKLVEAYARAQQLTRAELAEVFRDPEAEADEELDAAAGEPVSDTGKDEPETPSSPESSLSSASEPA